SRRWSPVSARRSTVARNAHHTADDPIRRDLTDIVGWTAVFSKVECPVAGNYHSEHMSHGRRGCRAAVTRRTTRAVASVRFNDAIRRYASNSKVGIDIHGSVRADGNSLWTGYTRLLRDFALAPGTLQTGHTSDIVDDERRDHTVTFAP